MSMGVPRSIQPRTFGRSAALRVPVDKVSRRKSGKCPCSCRQHERGWTRTENDRFYQRLEVPFLDRQALRGFSRDALHFSLSLLVTETLPVILCGESLCVVISKHASSD